MLVWEISTLQILHPFHTTNEPDQLEQFKWSFDGTYLARPVENGIAVYETNTMQLLKTRPVKIDHVTSFSWAPCSYMFSFWVPETVNNPARIGIYDLKTNLVMRTKNLFNVKDCLMTWQSTGSYLAVKVDRYTKAGKFSSANIEIFRLNEKEIPVEVLDMKGKLYYASIHFDRTYFCFVLGTKWR